MEIFFFYSRKKQFKLWLEAFNLKYKENIPYLDFKSKPTLKDAWLCEFTDAEGCFTCSLYKNVAKTSTLVKLRYILSQKGNSGDMDYLAEITKGKKHYLKSYNGFNVVVNTTKLSLIIKYFNVYPLITKKHITYLNWVKIYINNIWKRTFYNGRFEYCNQI